jgi:nucleoid DNA-binding protein
VGSVLSKRRHRDQRPGRNPATGEQITIAAKPASVNVRARPLARAKAALPCVQKARRRLAK